MSPRFERLLAGAIAKQKEQPLLQRMRAKMAERNAERVALKTLVAANANANGGK